MRGAAVSRTFVSEGVSGPVVSKSIIDVLAERAEQQPDDISYTFIDYDVDPAGFAEPLTWAQLYNRVQVVAGELRKLGKVGDRAAILAPQSLDYIVSFLGALEAGFVAVPLSVPMMGVHDERATAVLKDCTPTVVLTTSAAVDAVMPSLAFGTPTSKCRCGPVVFSPVFPTNAIASPPFTGSPSFFNNEPQCLYTDTKSCPCCI